MTETRWDKVDDRTLVGSLASNDPETADAAVAEIMRRGIKMIEFLLMLRENRSVFRGWSLMNPSAAMLLPVAVEGFPVPEKLRHKVLRVDAAALYLISAIRHGNVHFAQSPLLYDPAEPMRKREAANTPARVARAYDAAETWYRASRRSGIAKGDPIEASGLIWY